MFKSKIKYVLIFIAALFLIRACFYEPYRIPSQSMNPTLLRGDYIWVELFSYGIRVPFTKIWLVPFAGPKRGDVVVFQYNDTEDKDYIKRIVGLPGDKVRLKDGELFVNDHKVSNHGFHIAGITRNDHCLARLVPDSLQIVPQTLKPVPYSRNYKQYAYFVEVMDEGTPHFIMKLVHKGSKENFELTVPAGAYFALGDNRDRSHDSRMYGTVPRKNIKGRATSIWLSVNKGPVECWSPFGGPSKSFRWYRVGRDIL